MNNSIALLAGLKNNLKYTKYFYHTTREIYPQAELVFVSFGSTDGTHEWLDSLNDPYLRYHYSSESKSLSDTYNLCIELATKPFVAFVHNDMVLGPGFIEHLENNLSDKNILCYVVVEPPVFAHDERAWKSVVNYGFDVESFNKDGFRNYVLQVQNEKKNAALEDKNASFFLCVSRNVLLSVGGLDPIFNPMFCEDDDLILRLKLYGLEPITAPSAMAYHFVSKTSRFSDEYKNYTQAIELQSNRNFIRKWRFSVLSATKKKYDFGFIIHHATEEILKEIEPYCSHAYVDCNVENYLSIQQPATSFNLKDKFRSVDDHKTNDILVTINGKKWNDRLSSIVKKINEYVEKHPQNETFLSKILGIRRSKFKIRGISVCINQMKSYEKDLIHRKI